MNGPVLRGVFARSKLGQAGLHQKFGRTLVQIIDRLRNLSQVARSELMNTHQLLSGRSRSSPAPIRRLTRGEKSCLIKGRWLMPCRARNGTI
jgi:hypothetical protein